MLQLIEANWPLVAGAVAVLLLLAVLLLRSRTKTPERREFNDVLSEGAAPAQRNTALIDAPPAAAIVPPPAPAAPPPAPADMAPAEGTPVDVAPAPAAPEANVVPPPVGDDDLTRIKGLGPKLRATLAGLGVTRFAQIAAWSEADIARIDAQLGAFAGRPTRDNWVEQARLLSAGETGAYEEKFGKL